MFRGEVEEEKWEKGTRFVGAHAPTFFVSGKTCVKMQLREHISVCPN